MQEAERIWRAKSDDDVIEAAETLAEFTEEGERIIRAELRRRGLPEPPAPVGRCSRCGRSINEDDPGTECAQCGEPFPDAIRSALAASEPGADDLADEPGSTEFVYRSKYLHEVNLVAEEFEQAGIACCRSVERTGARFAMPVAAPIACLQGNSFLVVVPASDADRARELVESLPVSHEE